MPEAELRNTIAEQEEELSFLRSQVQQSARPPPEPAISVKPLPPLVQESEVNMFSKFLT